FRHVYSDTGDYVPEVVLEDDAGSVWIGFHAGLARFDRAGGAMHMWQADHPTDPAPDGRVVALVQAAEGLVWAVTAYDGVQARDREGRVRERVEPGDGRGLEAGRYVSHAGRGPDGALWVAGEPGLLMWNSGTRALEPVPGAPADEVGTFVVEGHRRVWTARSGALESFTWDGARLRPEMQLGVADGVPLVEFAGMAVDADGVVWLTSARGLVRADPRRRMVNVFGVSQGLPAQDITTAPVPGRVGGRLHMSTSAGLVIF